MLEYKELDDLVRRYRAKDPNSAAELIMHFEGFLVKFLNLIKGVKFDISDTPLRLFVSLYIKKPYILKRINGYYKYSDVTQELFKRATWIADMFKEYDRDEIYNELVCSLLEMASRYKLRDDGVYCFHTYVQKSFHFYAYRYCQKLISDPLAFSSNEIISYIDDETGNTMDFIDNIIAKRSGIQVGNLVDEIDDNWINGITCDEIYLKFTPIDRKILQLYYIHSKSDQKIANKLGLCRATINRKRLAAKMYIKGHAHGKKKQT